jgi:hypothetical protein
MAQSPAINSSEVLRLWVFVNGTLISDDMLLRSIEINQCVGKVCQATIILSDANNSNDARPIENYTVFAPSAKIEVHACYGSQPRKPLFSGIIVGHGLSLDAEDRLLVLECFDDAIDMTLKPRTDDYKGMTNGELIEQLIKRYSVTKGKTHSTSQRLVQAKQINTSDWDYLNTQAALSGLLIANYQNTVFTIKPTKPDKALLRLTYGVDMISFDAKIDAFANTIPLSQPTGSVTFQGSSLANIGSVIRLELINKHFDGDVMISAVTHTLKDGDWLTKVHFGIQEAWFAQAISPPKQDIKTDSVKSFTTSSGHKLTFDDHGQTVSVLTAAGNSLVLDDNNKSIQLSDIKGSKISLNTNGIELYSSKDICLKADGKISITALDEIELDASKDLNASASNVSLDARVSLSAKGMSTELSSSGQTVIKGAMVTIN